jgi:hypothetical protein
LAFLAFLAVQNKESRTLPAGRSLGSLRWRPPTRLLTLGRSPPRRLVFLRPKQEADHVLLQLVFGLQAVVVSLQGAHGGLGLRGLLAQVLAVLEQDRLVVERLVALLLR